jgi:hypothetical protein
MEFISGGSNADPYREGYYFRMQYPESYKCNTTKIIKFDRDYNREIEYNFFGLFPLALSSTPVSYNGSDILRISASFNYERYVCGKVLSWDVQRNINNNILSNVGSQPDQTNQKREEPTIFRTGTSLGLPGGAVPTQNVPGSVFPKILR